MQYHRHSCTNLLCTNLAPRLFCCSSLPSLCRCLPLFSVTSCVGRPPSESQAPWLFQSPTPLKPLLGSTTPAGLVGSCHSRRARPSSSTRERPTTGGRDDIMEWMDWCHTSTLSSKTCKMWKFNLILIKFRWF